MSEPIYEDPSVPVVNGPSAASAAENRETSIFTRSHRSGGLHDNHGNRHGLQPLPPAEPKVLSSSRPTRPAMRRGRSVEARKKRGTESISPGRTQASRISKSVGNVRRSARIAERAKMKQDSSPPSNTVKATCQMSAKVVQTAVAEAPSSSKNPKGKKARLLTTETAKGATFVKRRNRKECQSEVAGNIHTYILFTILKPIPIIQRSMPEHFPRYPYYEFFFSFFFLSKKSTRHGRAEALRLKAMVQPCALIVECGARLRFLESLH